MSEPEVVVSKKSIFDIKKGDMSVSYNDFNVVNQENLLILPDLS